MCIHYWDISPSIGLVSTGTCRYCGEIRMFPNEFTYSRYKKPVNLMQTLADKAAQKKIKEEVMLSSWSRRL